MKDIVIVLMFALFTAMAIFNFVESLYEAILHAGKYGKSGRGTIVTLKKAMRRDRARLFVPADNKIDVKTVGCDYMADLEYQNEEGDTIFLKDFIIPSNIKLINGIAEPIYRQGQVLPVKYSPKHARRVVVDLPEVRTRQYSIFWLIVWGATSVMTFLITFSMAVTMLGFY